MGFQFSASIPGLSVVPSEDRSNWAGYAVAAHSNTPQPVKKVLQLYRICDGQDSEPLAGPITRELGRGPG